MTSLGEGVDISFPSSGLSFTPGRDRLYHCGKTFFPSDKDFCGCDSFRDSVSAFTGEGGKRARLRE